MKSVYSVYEAKARLSEILRLVREYGVTITVSHHGEPVAEIRPVERRPEDALEARTAELERRGAIVRAGGESGGLRPISHRPGALDRFLAERDG